MTEWTLMLPYVTPPLNDNQRLHYRTKARLVAQIVRDVAVLARAAKIPALPRCEVWLYYAPPGRRRRDADNLNATYKPCCDGLVVAGIVRDDTPDLMVKHMPIIAGPWVGGRLWLRVHALDSSSTSETQEGP